MAGLTVADVLVDGLARAGALGVFSGPGAAPGGPLGEALERRGLRSVSSHAPVLMAAVTATLTDVPGAAILAPDVLASSADDLAQAGTDRAPLVVITEGASESARAGVAHAVKASLAVDQRSAAHWIAHAVQLAWGAPSGPVHVDVPPGVAAGAALPLASRGRPSPPPPPETALLDRAAALLAQARHPVLIAGLGCRSPEAAAWLPPLAEALPAPVLVTVRAKGAVPDPHPLVLGLLGADQSVLASADLIVAVGVDAVEIPDGFQPKAPLLHLAPGWGCTAALGAALEVGGPVDLIIAELAPRLRRRARADWDVAALDAMKRAGRLRAPSPSSPLDATGVAQIARDVAPPGTVAVVDAGPGAAALAAGWDALAPREFLAALDHRPPGFAVPAAIAASLARPEVPVVAFTDHHGLRAAAADLATMVRLGSRVSIVVLDGVGGPASTDIPDAPTLACRHVETRAALGPALAAALAGPGPALVVTRTV